MKITALAPWFGSKRTLAPRIVEQLGPHRAYWEPFCGSMAVLLAKPEVSHETVNDLHGELVNLARIVRHESLGPKLYRRLRRVMASQTLMEESRKELSGQVNGEPDLKRAECYFISSWLGMSGTAGTAFGFDTRGGIARRFSSAGGAPAGRFAAAVESIPAWRDRMRRVTVLNDDGLELCERIEDASGTVIYADPPYLQKSVAYLHDFASDDHKRLASLLSRFKETRVVG